MSPFADHDVQALGKLIESLLPRDKVLYFAPCQPNSGVGGGARLANMLSALDELRYDVRLVVYTPGHKLRLVKVLLMLRVLVVGLLFGWRAKRIMAHAPTIASGFPALLVAKLYRKPLIIDHMDSRNEQTPLWMHRAILKNASSVFCISHYLEQEVKELGGDAVYLPAFVDTNMFRPGL